MKKRIKFEPLISNDLLKEMANYFVNNLSTIRKTAKEFHVSKSGLHKAFISRLPYIDDVLYHNVCNVILKNKNERHMRGGLSTKQKYQKFNK